MVQVPRSDQAIAAVVAGPREDQRRAVRAGRVLRQHRAGHAQPGQLHELVHAEAERAHELLVDSRGLVLAPARRHGWPHRPKRTVPVTPLLHMWRGLCWSPAGCRSLHRPAAASARPLHGRPPRGTGPSCTLAAPRPASLPSGLE